MSSIGQGSISIDDSARIGENAQDTANKVAGNVSDINSDNKLTPTEKLKLKQECDKDVELYNIDIEQLKSVNLPTGELDSAMSNLTNFVTPLFKEMNRTSTVDRDALDSVFTAFATADKNSSQAFVNMVQQVADSARITGEAAKAAGDNAQKTGAEAKKTGEAAKAAGEAAQKTADEAKKAGEDAKKTANEAKIAGDNAQKTGAEAKIAGDNAQKTGEEAKRTGEAAKKAAGQAQADATQAKADAATAQQKAQSSIDQLNKAKTQINSDITDAKNSAQKALDNITVVDSKVTKLSDSTTSQFDTLKNGYQEVISTVNNMDIGGTNLIKDSSSDVVIDDTVNKQGWAHSAIYSELEAGQEYTFTSSVTVDAGKAENICINLYNPTTKETTLASNRSVVNGKIEYTFKAVKYFPQLLIYAGTMGGTQGNKVTFHHYQLEKGNKATDWSPAPEDLASQTQITTLNNLIDQKVSNDQYQSDKTQTADLISQTVTNAVNNINVGGRNYLLATGTPFTKTIDASAGNIYDFNYWYSFGELNKAPFKKGMEVMWSFDWEVSNMTSYGQIEMYLESSPFSVNKVIGSIGAKDLRILPSATNTSGHAEAYVTVNENFLKNASKQFKHGVMKPFKGTLTFKNVQLVIGNKPASWSPAPEDFAASTEIDQLNNAIKLKADSTDVTSQINVAIKGVQTDVTNKVSNLTTKVSQTDSAWRASVNTLGTTNMVYNGGFAHGVDGWNTQNGKWGWSNQAQDQVQGSNAIQARFTGLTKDGWNNASSKPFLVRSGQKMSIGVIVTPWVLDSEPRKGFGIGIDFYASTDGTGARNNSYHPEQWVYTTGRQQLKVENIIVPDGANSAVVRLYIQRNGGANFTRVQANMTPTLPQFIDGFATATDITASIDDIHLGVKNADGSTSNFNMNGNTILMDTAQTIISGKTSILDGTIDTAKIANAAINTAQIADGAINNAKIANAAINNAKIANAAIDGAKIANAAINTAQIADGAINNAKIGHLAVNNAQIADGAINSAKISNAAINTAQIADGAINNAKIANAAINDAKISNLNGNKIIAGSITANKINVDDLIANGINTKTLTAVNLNASTLTTPQLDLGLNGTFTEDFDYTQPTSWFLPKMNKGTLTFNHGVLQSKGTMQTYVNSQWGGMNDQLTFQSGISNAQWTEVAPGYIKMDLYKQNGTDIAQRTYSDPTGFYYTSATGDKSYLGNVLQTGQVQSGSILGKYIGPMDGQLRLQIAQNGNHYGLQVGSYAGQEAVLSDFIYNSTVSYSPDVHINSTGRLVRSTSASKYKYNIKNPDIETTLGDRLLNVHLATWNDKRAVDSYAEQLSTGKESEKSSIDKFYGLIAEQLRDAGLDMFITYGKNHEIEGIQYDRAWVPLLSVIRRLNDKVNEYELRLSKLEGTNK